MLPYENGRVGADYSFGVHRHEIRIPPLPRCDPERRIGRVKRQVPYFEVQVFQGSGNRPPLLKHQEVHLRARGVLDDGLLAGRLC